MSTYCSNPPHPDDDRGTTGQAPHTDRTNKLATAGFVCAPVGAVLSLLSDVSVFGIPILAVSLVFSAVGLSRSAINRGLALAGLVIALVALPVDVLVVSAAFTDTSGASSATTVSDHSSSTGSIATTSSSNSTSTTDAGWSSSDQAYLATLAKYSVPISSDTAAVNVGHAVCRYLDAGGTTINAHQILVGDGFSSTDAWTIVGAAEGAYCPGSG